MKLTRILALLISFIAPFAALAETLGSPTGPVILTVSGNISKTNALEMAQFDMAMLDALPGRETIIETPWYDGTRRFEGPLLAEILSAVGAVGQTVKVTALNDYSAEMPFNDAIDYPVILALRIDGDLIPVRSKGPGFIIYPFDEEPSLYNEMIFGRSVWQVTKIEIF